MGCRIVSFAAMAALLAFSSESHTQVPRVGVLAFTTTTAAARKAFIDGLREHGYTDGKNIVIEWRAAEGRTDRAKLLAEEFARLKLDVIVASLTPAVQAAKDANADTPIVMAYAGAPETTGFVNSLSRPGGNITGLSASSSELAAKRLQLLRDIVPGVSRVGVLVNTTDPFSKPFIEENQAAAKKVGLLLQIVDAHTPAQLDSAFAAMMGERVGAALFQGVFYSPSWKAGELCLKHHLPCFGTQRQFADSGGLISYGASLVETHRRAASFVYRILKGAKPSDLPVELPTEFELVINRKTANAMGIAIPQSLLLRADRVIE